VIKRIVMLKLEKALSTAEGRAEVTSTSLSILRGIPGVVHVSVGSAADHASESAWDVCLVLDFESLDELEPFRVNPEHRAYVDDYLRPKLKALAAWNFEIFED
jgi:hypothetical protein